MSLSRSRAGYLDSQRWDRFLTVLHDQGINQRYWRWYVLRAEQYLKANSDQPLDRHTGREVTT